MAGALLKFWLFGLAAMLAACTAVPAAAAIPLKPCLAKIDPAANEAERLVQSTNNLNCDARQSRLGGGNFAIQMRFAPKLSSHADPLIFSHSSVWQDRERVIFHYVDGTTTAVEFGSDNASRFLALGATFQIAVPPHAAPLDAIHVQTLGSKNWRGVMLGPRLMNRSEAESINGWLIALYAGFGGLSMALLAYNLALWHALRHRFQLYYCAMIAAVSAYAFTSSGALMLALPWIDNNDRLRLNYIILGIAAVAVVQFMLDYFGRANFSPWLRRAIACFSVFMIVDAVAFVLLAQWLGQLFDGVFLGSGAILLSLIFPLLYQAWQARAQHFWLFVAAWSAPVIASILRAAHGFGLVEYSFLVDNGNLIALSIESMFSTMLIVARLRDLSAERDLAQAGERSAMRLANSDSLTGLLNRRAFLDLAIGRTLQ